MTDLSTVAAVEPLKTRDYLETAFRGEVQKHLQELLEEEVDEFLGRLKYERRQTGSAKVYRNGYGRERKLTYSGGTIGVRRPRVRGLTERFESVILPLFQRHTETVRELLPELYLHGLAQGDFDLALRGLLGEDAPLSGATLMRLKAKWQDEYDRWKQSDLSQRDVAYAWADGIYVKAGLEKDKAALLVVIVAWADGSKEVVSVQPGQRESTEAWSQVLRQLKARGLISPVLMVGDGHLGLWGALAEVYPGTQEQRCWNHRIRNVLDKVPKRLLEEARPKVCRIPQAASRAEAEKAKKEFQKWCREKECTPAGELLDQDWERMITFYAFPKEHWVHLRTTNPVESPFNRVRLRTSAARRFKKVNNATAVIWKTLMIAQKRFRSLNAPEYLPGVLQRDMLKKMANSLALPQHPA